MNFVFGQSSQRDYNEVLRYQNDAINKMKKEIEELSSKLRKANIRETTASSQALPWSPDLVNSFVHDVPPLVETSILNTPIVAPNIW